MPPPPPPTFESPLPQPTPKYALYEQLLTSQHTYYLINSNLLLLGVLCALFLAIISWLRNRNCSSDSQTNLTRSFKGKTILLTGANTGIGAQLARSLARRGARLLLLCRDTERAKQVSDSIIAENACADVTIHHVDLSSLTSVRIVASEILQTEERIDALIHCASVAYLPKQTKSIDGHELTLATNYLGPYLLTHLLVDRLKQTAEHSPVKVIYLSSAVHRLGKIHLADLNLDSSYSPLSAYAQSKLATILSIREWSRQLIDSRVHFYALNAGLTRATGHFNQLPVVLAFFAKMGCLLLGQSTQGASERILGLWCEEADQQTGYYYGGKGPNIEKPACQAMDDRMAKSLWTETVKRCGIEQ